MVSMLVNIRRLAYSKHSNSLCIIPDTGEPFVPFVNFGSSGGSLRFVLDGSRRVDLPSPPLVFGSSTFTTAFVSDCTVQCLYPCRSL